MSLDKGKLLREALSLSPIERAELVENILQSFEFNSREEVDALWADKAEDRINAHDRGDIKVVSAKEVFDGIERKRA